MGSVSPGQSVLDVGCGTGIAARQLQAAGATVLGVEPDARMASFARRSGVDVEVARFENWETKSRQFDVVVAGQARPGTGWTPSAEQRRRQTCFGSEGYWL